MRGESNTHSLRIENAIALALSVGIGVAVAVVLMGILITLSSQTSLWRSVSTGYVHSLRPVPFRPALLLYELHHSPGIAAMSLGLFLIVCTPLARLTVSAIMLVRTHEYRFVPLTVFVLLVIAASIVLSFHLRH